MVPVERKESAQLHPAVAKLLIRVPVEPTSCQMIVKSSANCMGRDRDHELSTPNIGIPKRLI